MPVSERDLSLPAAVLWDMDGTIIDTEPFWIAEEHALVQEAGGTWTDADAMDLVGQDLLVSARLILERSPVRGTPEEVVERLVTGVIRRAQQRLPWRPGARELLADLADRGVPAALVTMSWMPLAEVLLAQLPPGTFAAVVTGDQVGRGKPHPDPYLLAAERLGVAPADSVAIEDSPTGIASALAAGVPTLGVPHLVPLPQRQGLVQVPTLAGLGAADLRRLTNGTALTPRRGLG